MELFFSFFIKNCINKVAIQFSGIFYKTKTLNAPPRSCQYPLLCVSGFFTGMVSHVFIPVRGIISKANPER